MKIVKQFSAFNAVPEYAMNSLEEIINSFIEDQNWEIISISHSIDRYQIDVETGFLFIATALVVCSYDSITQSDFGLGA